MPSTAVSRRWRLETVIPGLEIHLRKRRIIVFSIPSEAVGRIAIKDRGVLSELFRNPSLGLARAYADGDVEVEGDLVGTLCALLKSTLSRKGPRTTTWGTASSVSGWTRR